MKFCTHCGAQVAEGVAFCTSCGAAIEASAAPSQAAPEQVAAPVQPQAAPQMGAPAQDMSEKGLAVLAYIIPLIPYLMKPKTEFGKFHAAQGLNIWIIDIIAAIASSIMYSLDLGFFSSIINIFSKVLYVLNFVGLIWAAQGKQKELPIVGSIKIFK